MTSRHIQGIPQALLITVAAIMFVASCQSADDTSVATALANSADTTSAPASTATSQDTVPDAVPLETVDLSEVAPADAEGARSVLELAASLVEDRSMAAGPWFSSTYTEAVAFDLGEPGRLVEQGLGWTTIEVGDPETDTHGLIRIVEVVAFASPDGPIPISLVGPDAEFADTDVLRRGTADSPRGELSWRDAVMVSDRIAAQFQKACGFDPDDTCVDVLIAEGGPVVLETDYPTRFTVQPFGSRKLYVVATALGVEQDVVLDQAFHIAASIVTTDRTEDAGRRPLTTLGMRAGSIPAGNWFVPMGGGITAELDLAQDAEGVSVLGTGPTWFALEATSESGDRMILSAQVFQGFVDGALEGTDANAELPLSADVFLRGIDAITPIEDQGPSTIAGLPSQFFDAGSAPADSPFACTAVERRDLDPDETCLVFSIDGWRFVDSADQPYGYRYDYVEELGVLVGYSGVPGTAGFVVHPQFGALLDGLTLTAS